MTEPESVGPPETQGPQGPPATPLRAWMRLCYDQRPGSEARARTRLPWHLFQREFRGFLSINVSASSLVLRSKILPQSWGKTLCISRGLSRKGKAAA